MENKITSVIISPSKKFNDKYCKLLNSHNYFTKAIKYKDNLNILNVNNSADFYLIDNVEGNFPVEYFLNHLEEKKSITFVVIIGTNMEIKTNESIPVFFLNPNKNTNEYLIFINNLKKIFIRDRIHKELVSMLLHDVRSPLNSLIGYIELLLKKTFGELNDGQTNILEKVMDLGDSTLDMLEDLNELYRDLQYTESPHMQKFYFKKTLDSVLINTWVKADRKNIKIKKEISSDLKFLYGDDYQIQRALTNLISNAIKYSPDNSKIKIIANKIENDFVLITVADSGKGVSQEKLPNLFDKYYRLIHKYDKSKGYGLGLYIAKNIVKNHGGDIWAENNEAGGLSIHLTLPLNGDNNKTKYFHI